MSLFPRRQRTAPRSGWALDTADATSTHAPSLPRRRTPLSLQQARNREGPTDAFAPLVEWKPFKRPQRP